MPNIHTEAGFSLMAQAVEIDVPVKITSMSVGDGGGSAVEPNALLTALVNQVYQAEVRRVFQSVPGSLRFTAELLVPASVAAFTMREVGVWVGSTLFAVGSMTATTKPAGVAAVLRFEFDVQNSAAVAVLGIKVTVPAGRQTIYRMGRDVAQDHYYWLSWPTVVHAVRGFESGDTTERTYYSGDGAPKVTDNTIALASAPFPTAHRPLGIPAPATAMLVAQDSGTWTGDAEAYVYTYTYVNDWGWESAPAPASLLHTRPSDATATLSSFAAVPAGNYAIDRMRIYRTQTGATGATEFFFLREIAIGVTSTADDNRTVGEVLPTTTWLAPPDDLSHLCTLWNGMMAGISGGEVRFSEPYVPYAWPIAYDVLPPDSKAVALGVFGQQLLVLTTGRPLLVQGSSPDSMDQMPLEIPQACIAPRSVASMGSGVAWASNDGLCWYGAGGARILTAGLLTREQWLALKPDTLIGRMLEGLYLGSYDDGIGRKAFLIDPMNPTGLYFLDAGYEAMHFDELQDQLYVLNGTSVQRWDAGGFMTTTARSKEFRAPRPMNFGWAEVTADSYPVTVRFDSVNMPATDVSKLTAAIPFLTAPTATSVRYTATVASRKPFPLPSGWLADDFQIEVATAGAVQGVAMSTSVQELAQV